MSAPKEVPASDLAAQLNMYAHRFEKRYTPAERLAAAQEYVRKYSTVLTDKIPILPGFQKDDEPVATQHVRRMIMPGSGMIVSISIPAFTTQEDGVDHSEEKLVDAIAATFEIPNPAHAG